MKVKIYRELYQKLGGEGNKVLKEHYGVYSHYFRYDDKFSWIDLASVGLVRTKKLLEMAEKHTKVRGTKLMITDIKAWITALESGGKKIKKPRSVQQFAAYLQHLISLVPGQRIYKHDADANVNWPYYVDEIKYHPPNTRDNSPPFVTMHLLYVGFGVVEASRENFDAGDCLRVYPQEALAAAGFFTETDALRETYLKDVEHFNELWDKVGTQCLAGGIGTDDLDGNPDSRRESWYWSRTNRFKLDKAGVRSRVVIDVFKEDDSESSNRRRRNSRDNHPDRHYWPAFRAGNLEQYIDDGELSDEAAQEAEKAPLPEVPIHVLLATFDLKRHLRLKVHASQVTKYEYDPTLGAKLILPEEVLDLVEVLISQHRGTFKDIVGGKGGGAPILCAGPPGVGKTLTAEVYAEVMQRPLYSVQASQLGTTPDDLEDELLKIFARAARWGAILLLDEADVYISKRGDDIDQNAIVGVFLRVLEYYQGVLFMTTNRSDSVDDAIASRCVARIDYALPTKANQARIWRVLADTSEIELSNEDIKTIVRAFPNLSGRDIKNLLKLAHLVSLSKGTQISPESIAFVKRFKPTTTSGETKPLAKGLDDLIEVLIIERKRMG